MASLHSPIPHKCTKSCYGKEYRYDNRHLNPLVRSVEIIRILEIYYRVANSKCRRAIQRIIDCRTPATAGQHSVKSGDGRFDNDKINHFYIPGQLTIKIPAQRLLLKEGRVSLVSDEMMQMFHLMEEQNAILSIDLADGDLQVGEMEEIIQECPNLKIAVGHFGMVTRKGWEEQIKLARHKNVRIESGGITWLFNDEFYPFHGAVRAIKEAADIAGMDKLMWGSDYPRTITAITYRMSYDFVLKSKEMTEEEKNLFLGGNAARFYGLSDLIELPYIKNMSE